MWNISVTEKTVRVPVSYNTRLRPGNVFLSCLGSEKKKKIILAKVITLDHWKIVENKERGSSVVGTQVSHPGALIDCDDK